MTHLEEPSGIFWTISWARSLLFSLTVKYNTLSAALFVQGYLVRDSHYETRDGPLERYVPQLNLQGFLSKTATPMVPSWMDGWLAYYTTPYRPSHQSSLRTRESVSLLAASAIQCSTQLGQACACVTASLIALFNIDLPLCSSTSHQMYMYTHTHTHAATERIGH